MNNDYIAEMLSGLVSLTNSIPETLQDGNGDSIADCLMQGIKDVGASLDVTFLVNWHAVGALAKVAVLDANSVEKIKHTIQNLSALGEELRA